MDEAYAEFSGVTVVPWIRTLRCCRKTFTVQPCCVAPRAVIAREDSLFLVRRAMPPFPVNLAALVAAEAAVRDRAAMQTYVKNVKRLRASLAMELNGLREDHPSAGNFLLADFGSPALRSLKARTQGIPCATAARHRPGSCSNHYRTRSEMHRLLQAIRKDWKARS